MSRFEIVNEPCTDCGVGGQIEVLSVEYPKGVFTPLCGDCQGTRAEEADERALCDSADTLDHDYSMNF